MSIYTTTVDTSTLALHLDDPAWIIVDCRFRLNNPQWGLSAYAEGHIPGARYAHLDRDLAGRITEASGRHPLPDMVDFAAKLGLWGITKGTQVVAYDDTGGAIAARLWWLMRQAGHYGVAVLDGGITAWRSEGRPVAMDVPEIRQNVYFPNLQTGVLVDTASLLKNLGSKSLLIIDARAEPRFRGDQEPIDPVAGHIPGAVNWPFDRNLDASGRFRGSYELRDDLAALVNGRATENVVHMCGSGVTACHNILAMEIGGLQGSRLYAGSWSEWIRDPSRPRASSP